MQVLRKVKKARFHPDTNDSYAMVFVLCDDDSMWLIRPDKDEKWLKLPDIPKEEPEKEN